jgi:hypothetical protein
VLDLKEQQVKLEEGAYMYLSGHMVKEVQVVEDN